MKRSTLGSLALAVFGLVLVAFLVRGLGQFVLGQQGVLQIAGPISLVAAGLLVVVLVLWGLGRLGVVTIEDSEE